MSPRTTPHRRTTRSGRRARAPQAPTLFDAPAPEGDPALVDDLEVLAGLGLIEARPSPEGVLYALTDLGAATEPDPGA
jgi:hypothetical protein